jgi:hypothetical protein
LRAQSDEVVRLRRLWNEHTHVPFPATGNEPSVQEVALYASWLGSMVESVLSRGSLDSQHAAMLKTRRTEGSQALFRAAGELGDPMRSYVARLITIEDLLSAMSPPPRSTGRSAPSAKRSEPGGDAQ